MDFTLKLDIRTLLNSCAIFWFCLDHESVLEERPTLEIDSSVHREHGSAQHRPS